LSLQGFIHNPLCSCYKSLCAVAFKLRSKQSLEIGLLLKFRNGMASPTICILFPLLSPSQDHFLTSLSLAFRTVQIKLPFWRLLRRHFQKEGNYDHIHTVFRFLLQFCFSGALQQTENSFYRVM
jgi:hypothetical protein